VPQQNRVTPLGQIVAVPERGLVFGNRGCLHNAEGRIVRRQATRRWIACRLEFKDWRRPAENVPGRYTGLYFLDDATAMAAGHRACSECRRADYVRVRDRLALGGADAIDAQLAAERDGSRRRVAVSELPDGAFVLWDGAPHLVLEDTLRRWTPGGYDPPVPASGAHELITPRSLVEVLRAGWEPLVPFIHASART
jgi:hypothetical protein